MTTGGNRYNEGKLKYALVSPYAEEGLTGVLTYGEKKYTKWAPCDCRDPGLIVTAETLHTKTCASKTVKLYEGAWNWAKGLSWTDTVNSLRRHLIEFLKGNDYDDGPGGSGLLHIDHIQCNAHFLSHFQHTKTGTDDRWRLKRGLGDFLTEMTKEELTRGHGVQPLEVSARVAHQHPAQTKPAELGWVANPPHGTPNHAKHYAPERGPDGMAPKQFICGANWGTWGTDWETTSCENCKAKKPVPHDERGDQNP